MGAWCSFFPATVHTHTQRLPVERETRAPLPLAQHHHHLHLQQQQHHDGDIQISFTASQGPFRVGWGLGKGWGGEAWIDDRSEAQPGQSLEIAKIGAADTVQRRVL